MLIYESFKKKSIQFGVTRNISEDLRGFQMFTGRCVCKDCGHDGELVVLCCQYRQSSPSVTVEGYEIVEQVLPSYRLLQVVNHVLVEENVHYT